MYIELNLIIKLFYNNNCIQRIKVWALELLFLFGLFVHNLTSNQTLFQLSKLSFASMASQASLLLQKQLKGNQFPVLFTVSFAWIFRCLLINLTFLADLCKHPVDGFSAGLVDETNIFEWSVTIIGPPDTL